MTAPAQHADELEADQSGSGTEPDGRPVVFVVDDDPGTIDLLSEVAHGVGWAAHGFSRLAELEPELARQRPELLILDDDLPDGRGGDLARELRESPGLAEVPLLVCTGAHPMRRAEIGSWAPVVSKPFDVEEIEAFLGAAARRRRRGSGREYGVAG